MAMTPCARAHARSRFGPLALLLLGLAGAVLLRGAAFLGFAGAAPSGVVGRAAAAGPRPQLAGRREAPRAGSAALAARGGDEEEEEEEDDDYEFAGGEINIAALKVGQKLDGVVVNIRDFGAFVDFGGEQQGLVPRSKVADAFVENIEDHVKVGDSVPLWVSDLKDGKITMAMTPSRIYGPGRKADLGVFQGVSDEEWLSGTVVKVMNFGAFVQVQAPGSDEVAQGLVHVSQMGETRVEDPAAVAAIGDEVKVRVVQVDEAAGKISLSMKEKSSGGGGGGRGKADLTAFEALTDDEWLEGTIKGIVNFGAFVEVVPPSGGEPVQGLVHLSQIRDGFVEDAGEEVEVDQEVKVRVLSVNSEQGKLNLSMKAKPGQQTQEAAPAEAQPEAQEA